MDGLENDSNEYFDITIDDNFLANVLTSMLIMEGNIDNREYVTIEHIERDGDFFNIIVKRNKVIVN